MSPSYVLLVHGGAGRIGALTPEQEQLRRRALRQALEAGRDILAQGGSSVDAVIAAVRVLEECGLFNAGRGAVRNQAGFCELDAAVMEGRSRRAGAVAAVRRVRNPVDAAWAVAQYSPHVLLVGEGAEEFALQQGLELLPEPAPESGDGSIGAHPEASLGTVGAVALDASGNLAAATSTGGISGKLKGRVGDSPLIGAGTYADNRTCAVSTTGLGETFIRTVTAFGVHARMLFGKMPLHEAAADALAEVGQLGGCGGLIAIGADAAAVALCVNADMYRGRVDQHGCFQTAIYRDDPWRES